MAQEENQEIDLTRLLRKTKNGFDYLGILLLRAAAFLFRNVYVIVGLLVLGVILGYFWQRAQQKVGLADIIVYANVESADYLYDAVNLLNFKLRQRDTTFLQGTDLYKNGKPSLKAIEVNPVIDLKDLLVNYRGFDMEQVALILDNVEGNNSYFENSLFSREYHLYKIEIKLPSSTSDEIIGHTLHYLEDNDYLHQKLKVEQQDLQSIRKANQYTLKQIDSLLVNFNRSLLNGSGKPGTIEISGNNGMKFDEVLKTKSDLLRENNKIAKDLLRLGSLFYVVNKPHIFEKSSILDLKIILLPFALVFLFIMFHITLRLYRKVRLRIVERERSLSNTEQESGE